MRFYQFFISPLLRALFGAGCRYSPTCSVYADQAVQKYGIRKGGVMAVKRLLSCHAWSKKPFYDPVK